jgi:superfamily II DNA or RNA helicase
VILRPRQSELVDRAIDALKKEKNTIAIAPTGAGKTVMLSAVCERWKKVLVLQHRDELVDQNASTYRRVTGGDFTICDAQNKTFGDVTFAMVQTLARDNNLALMPGFDLLVIDEAHHVAAESYQKIIRRAKELNPKMAVFGVTATPERGDSKGLQAVFNNVCDAITLGELIADGHLVRPRTFVIDCGLGESLSKVRRTANDFDMGEVESIMNKQVVNDAVFREWKTKASDRQTVIFCSTIVHAEDVCNHFTAAGVEARVVHGEMSEHDRRKTLSDFDKGKFKIVVNVAVLTEGWDCQPVSCVILLRPCSHKSTMIQMIGRGLRKLDPERYPGVKKSDCLILDFGHSILTHGDIDAGTRIEERQKAEATPKECPECGTKHPAWLTECPVCGYEYEKEGKAPGKEREALETFGMTEVEIIEASPFRWVHLWDGAASVCSAMSAWAVVVCTKNGFAALGAVEKGKVRVLCMSDERVACIASADDYMRQHGDRDAARKSKSWLNLPATEKQLSMLGLGPFHLMNRYAAACRLTWKFNEERICKTIHNTQH